MKSFSLAAEQLQSASMDAAREISQLRELIAERDAALLEKDAKIAQLEAAVGGGGDDPATFQYHWAKCSSILEAGGFGPLQRLQLEQQQHLPPWEIPADPTASFASGGNPESILCSSGMLQQLCMLLD